MRVRLPKIPFGPSRAAATNLVLELDLSLTTRKVQNSLKTTPNNSLYQTTISHTLAGDLVIHSKCSYT